jgi:hypothetical protein
VPGTETYKTARKIAREREVASFGNPIRQLAVATERVHGTWPMDELAAEAAQSGALQLGRTGSAATSHGLSKPPTDGFFTTRSPSPCAVTLSTPASAEDRSVIGNR